MGEGLSKVEKSAITAGWRQKKIKLDWLKCPETVSEKTNLDQKTNDSRPHVWSLSFNFGFSRGHTIKTSQRIIYFAIQLPSKKPNSFYEPQLVHYYKKYTPAT